MKPTLKRILKIISNTLLISVVVLAFLFHGFQLFGIKPYTVLSGSMESVYPTGSLIYITKTDPAKLEINDVITFKMPSGIIATHRIIELVPDEANSDIIKFRTKGDENEIADGTLVDFSSIVGKPLFCIPFLGFIANYIMYPPGKYVVLSVAAVLILIEIIISVAFNDKNKKKSNTVQNENLHNKENRL